MDVSTSTQDFSNASTQTLREQMTGNEYNFSTPTKEKNDNLDLDWSLSDEDEWYEDEEMDQPERYISSIVIMKFFGYQKVHLLS